MAASSTSTTFEQFIDDLLAQHDVCRCVLEYRMMLDALLPWYIQRHLARVAAQGKLKSTLYATGVFTARVRHEHREAARWQRQQQQARALGFGVRR
jgi:hypothetical protein